MSGATARRSHKLELEPALELVARAAYLDATLSHTTAQRVDRLPAPRGRGNIVQMTRRQRPRATAQQQAKRNKRRRRKFAGRPAWRVYEQKAKMFFKSLAIPGCHVDKLEVDGARGHHEVDVLVTFSRFGIEHRWVVECKRHRARVTKAMVLTLAGVVEDVGADRGFLLSEVGFQPGAIDVARLRNITLTSLSELKKGAAADIIDGRIASLQQRFARAQVALHNRVRVLQAAGPSPRRECAAGDGGHGELHVLGILAICEHALKQGVAGQFPVRYPDPALIRDVGRDTPGTSLLVAKDPAKLASALDELIAMIEAWLATLPKPEPASRVLVALAVAAARLSE